jgi:hypothetical protein
MKFQKGLLSDVTPEKERDGIPSSKFQKGVLGDPISQKADDGKSRKRVEEHGRAVALQDHRLFETREEFEGSSRNYLKVFALVVGLVVVLGAAIFYFTLPGIGDQIHAPAGAEDAVRDNLLTKQKRTATDIVFFKCDGFYWARAGVETRKDIPNPIYRIDTYAAKVTQSGEAWDVSAQPVTSPDLNVPCK